MQKSMEQGQQSFQKHAGTSPTPPLTNNAPQPARSDHLWICRFRLQTDGLVGVNSWNEAQKWEALEKV